MEALKRKTCLIFLLFFSITISAQLQNKILGYTLGISQFDYVNNNLNAKGIDCLAWTSGKIEIKNTLSFGGYNWDYTELNFVGKKFSSASFTAYSFSRTQYEKLRNVLVSKYLSYQKPTKTSNGYGYGDTVTETFQDSKTTIVLFYNNNGSGYVSLTYKDRKLTERETSTSNSNEL